MHHLSQHVHWVKGIDPVADYGAGGVASDIVNMEAYHTCTFVIYLGVATGGTAAGTITVDACADVTPSATTAIPFKYKAVNATDIEGALTRALAAGVQMVAGGSRLFIVEVDAADVASAGYGYCRVAIAETVNDPVVGCVLAILSNPRYARDIPPTAIT